MAPRSQPRLRLQNQLLYTRIERHLVRANFTLLAHFMGHQRLPLIFLLLALLWLLRSRTDHRMFRAAITQRPAIAGR